MRIKKYQWTVIKDSRGRIGPYAHKGDQWVSFDDVSMIRHKSEYVKALGLGGAMIWYVEQCSFLKKFLNENFKFDRALDLDDFKNSCECEEYPLLRTINRVLRQYPGPHNNCFVEKFFSKPTAEATTTRKPEIMTGSPPPKRTTTTTLKPVVYEGEDFDGEEIYPDEIEEDHGCSGGSRNFAVHKADCSKYYICDHGSAIEREYENI